MPYIHRRRKKIKLRHLHLPRRSGEESKEERERGKRRYEKKGVERKRVKRRAYLKKERGMSEKERTVKSKEKRLLKRKKKGVRRVSCNAWRTFNDFLVVCLYAAVHYVPAFSVECREHVAAKCVL